MQLPTFKDFDPEAEVDLYWTDLPHWRQEGATYFVTFRLADSIPRRVLQGWAEIREAWYRTHGLTRDLDGPIWNQRYLAISELERRSFEREQSRLLFAELDRCRGKCELNDLRAATIVSDALKFFDGRLVRCGDFVVMPNHGHWLVLPLPGVKLERILQSVKRFSATRVNRLLGRAGRFWQSDSFDHIVRDREELARIRDYIEENPTKAGLSPGSCIYYRADWL